MTAQFIPKYLLHDLKKAISFVDIVSLVDPTIHFYGQALTSHRCSTMRSFFFKFSTLLCSEDGKDSPISLSSNVRLSHQKP